MNMAGGMVPRTLLKVVFPLTGDGSVRWVKMGSDLRAGHNKWSKVKHIKGPKDEARGRMFAKYGMMIRVAVKEGGSSNPDLNVALANLLEQCRSRNMPKASVEAAIKGAEKAAKALVQNNYEARGPGGCHLLIQILTENNARSHKEIKHLLNKNGGVLSDGARHTFSRKGVVMMLGEDISTERALELAIEAGAEDVRETEDEEDRRLLQFVCEPRDISAVRCSLEKMGGTVVSAGLEFIPHTPALLDHTQMEAASALIGSLNDCVDVVRVWDNIQARD